MTSLSDALREPWKMKLICKLCAHGERCHEIRSARCRKELARKGSTRMTRRRRSEASYQVVAASILASLHRSIQRRAIPSSRRTDWKVPESPVPDADHSNHTGMRDLPHLTNSKACSSCGVPVLTIESHPWSPNSSKTSVRMSVAHSSKHSHERSCSKWNTRTIPSPWQQTIARPLPP